MYTVKITKLGVLTSPDVPGLQAALRSSLDLTGYGASDIGARWKVTRDGAPAGFLSYNGRFEAVAS